MTTAGARPRPSRPVAWVLTGVLFAALAVGLLVDTVVACSVSLIVAGLACLVFFLLRPAADVRRDLDTGSGPGWWIGKLAALLPPAGAKAVALLLDLLVIALGVLGLTIA